MVARNVYLHLKPNRAGEFARQIEKEIIPLLRKQKGFQDEITFILSDGPQALAISLWDSKENAESYSRATFPRVLKSLADVIEGIPEVRSYDVANSTFHKVAPLVAA